MIALKIKNIKQFMNRLFASDRFDNFTVEEAVIKTFVTYNIDGMFEHGFYEEDDPLKGDTLFDGFTPWKLLRNNCTDLIKGKHTPVFMKFVFHGDTSLFSSYPEFDNIKALLIMIRFENTGLSLTTGTSMKEFSPDRTIDGLWDNQIKKLLTDCNCDYEEL